MKLPGLTKVSGKFYMTVLSLYSTYPCISSFFKSKIFSKKAKHTPKSFPITPVVHQTTFGLYQI